MLDIPLTLTHSQTKQLSAGSCLACDSLSSDQNRMVETDSAAQFAGLLAVLLNQDNVWQPLSTTQGSALSPLNMKSLQAGKSMPLISRLGGNTLPPDMQLQSILANAQPTLVEAELLKTNTAIEELIQKTPEQLEFLQTLFGKQDVQSSLLTVLPKNDLAGGIHHPSDQFGSLASLLNSINSANQLSHQSPLTTEAKPMMIDMRNPGWENQLGERVLWVVNQGLQGARLQLNPPELGPLKIDVAMEGEQLNVNFVTQNIQAKDAIDLSMPKLREMFLHSGIELADAQVFDQTSRHLLQQQAAWENDANPLLLNQLDEESNAVPAMVSTTTSYALIDAYA